MNVSVVLIIFGLVFISIPQTSWMGIATLAIGAVLYVFSQREPISMSPSQFKYMKYLQPPAMSRAGVEVTQKDQIYEYNKAVRDEVDKGPRIEKGMFKLPVPIDDEISQFTDVTYNVPTRAKNFTQEKDKGGNPWFPGL